MDLPSTQAYDLRFFPLVVLRLPETLNAGYVDLLEADTRLLFTVRSRYVSVADLSGVLAMPDAKTRTLMGEWAKSHEDDFRRWQVANALVVRSSMVRAGLSAIHWLAPPPVPTTVETDLSKGLRFLRDHAERAGLALDRIDAFSGQLSARASA